MQSKFKILSNDKQEFYGRMFFGACGMVWRDILRYVGPAAACRFEI